MNSDADEVVSSLRELASPELQKHDLSSVHIRATALVGRLKTINRASNAGTRSQKEATAIARQEMDQSHLDLQNLLYEKRHLEREIEKCRQFASIYQDVPLYSVDEFFELAPAEARGPEALADEHQLMLNRLSFEFVERTRLDEQRKNLAQQKEDLLRASKSKTTKLDTIKSQIDALVKTASDVQKKVVELVDHPPASIQNADRSE